MTLKPLFDEKNAFKAKKIRKNGTKMLVKTHLCVVVWIKIDSKRPKVIPTEGE